MVLSSPQSIVRSSQTTGGLNRKAEGLRCNKYFYILVILMLIVAGCYCGGNGSGVRGDVGMDTSNVCGLGRYPSFDYQCVGNIGCREVNRGRCGCRCVRCENEMCVEISCNGECVMDVGSDVDELIDSNDVRNVEEVGVEVEGVGEEVGVEELVDASVRDVQDVGGTDEIEYICKDPGDPVGIEFSGNLDEPIVYIGEVYMDAWITGEYVVWLEPGPSGWGKEVKYLSLVDRRVRRAPNCDGYDAIRQMVVYKDKVYWNNHIYLEKTKSNWDVMFYFNLTSKKIEIISPIDGVYFPKPYENVVLFNIVKKGRDYIYLYDVEQRMGRELTEEPILNDYGTALYKNLIVGKGREIFTINIDTFERKTYYTSDETFFANVIYSPIVPVMQYIGKEKYGHYTTDLYLVDIRTGEIKRVTDDEKLQWAGQRYENILIYHENEDIKSTDIGYGYIMVYDIETRVFRKVPRSEGLWLPGPTDGKRVLITNVLGSSVVPMYLMDLEKLGVVKDGHVVPE